MKDNHCLKVNEIFGPTIQGEGKSLGMTTVFVRFSGCNLACIWCDTPYCWNWEGTPFKHPEKYERKFEEFEMWAADILAGFKLLAAETKRLVITGGEPMLQQDKLIELLRLFKNNNYWIEIETNGTVEPYDELIDIVGQINCSPKTSNSGSDNRPEMREVPRALEKLSASEKTNFKFVVQQESDLAEIRDLVSRYNMKKVYLMAQCRTREEQDRLEPEVARMAIEHGYDFSTRLHIQLWNGARRK